MQIGEMILTERQRLGLNQTQLAQELGTNRTKIYLWESGQALPTEIEHLRGLERVLGLHLINRRPVADTIGARIRDAREALGWTQAYLAERAGVNPKMVSRWETGAHSPDRHLKLLQSLLGARLIDSAPPSSLPYVELTSMTREELINRYQLVSVELARISTEMAGRIPPDAPHGGVGLFESDNQTQFAGEMTLSQAFAQGLHPVRRSDLPPPMPSSRNDVG